MLRHVVVWTMAPGKADALDRLLAGMQRLPDEIDAIEALSCGPLLNESAYDGVLCVDLANEERSRVTGQNPRTSRCSTT